MTQAPYTQIKTTEVPYVEKAHGEYKKDPEVVKIEAQIQAALDSVQGKGRKADKRRREITLAVLHEIAAGMNGSGIEAKIKTD
jgi:hypothetical protein